MRNTQFIIVISLLLLFLSACDQLPKVDDMGKVGNNVAYIEELNQTSQLRFTVADNGGATEFTARVANPTDESTAFTIEVDESILEAYNTENNTSFKVLPADYYDLQVFDNEGKLAKEGKDLAIELASMQYGQKIKVNVKTMMKTVTNEDTGESTEEPLSYYSNYAIPVRMTNVKGGARIQGNGTTGILFLDRKFSMPVMHLTGSMGLIYKENTMPQSPEKSYDGDIKYPEWTCQYTFRLDAVASNTGLMYPNLRTNRDSPLYMTLYSGKLTLFASGGKVGLNQPKFEKFIFEAKKWYHMAISYKEEGGRPYLRLYINGELAYKSIWPKKVDEWPIIFLGNNNFRGYVRELRFWSKALTEGEINETLWFANPESEGLEVYLPLSTDMKGIIKGKEEDWINISTGATTFTDEFTFPAEE